MLLRSGLQPDKAAAQQTVAARRSAIEKYEQALPFFRDSGESYRQALTLLSIGFAYAQLNEFRRALQYFNETLSLAQSLKERRLEAATETFLGGMQDVSGDIGSALELLHPGAYFVQRKRKSSGRSQFPEQSWR